MSTEFLPKFKTKDKFPCYFKISLTKINNFEVAWNFFILPESDWGLMVIGFSKWSTSIKGRFKPESAFYWSFWASLFFISPDSVPSLIFTSLNWKWNHCLIINLNLSHNYIFLQPSVCNILFKGWNTQNDFHKIILFLVEFYRKFLTQKI